MIHDRDVQLGLGSMMFIAGSLAKDATMESILYVAAAVIVAPIAVDNLAQGIRWLSALIDRVAEKRR